MQWRNIQTSLAFSTVMGFSMYTSSLKLSSIVNGNNRNTTTLSPKFVAWPASYHLQKELRNETSKHAFKRGSENFIVQGLEIVKNVNEVVQFGDCDFSVGCGCGLILIHYAIAFFLMEDFGAR